MKNFDTDVINRVLKGDSTLEEAQSAVRWMRTKSRQSYLNNVIDKKFQQDETDVTVDVPSAEMKGRLFRALFWQSLARKKWLYVAAVLFMLVSGVSLYFISHGLNNDTVQWKETYVPNGKRTHLILADGTSVYLGSDSYFKYPVSFRSNDRAVVLSGEGYFDVKSDSQCPFYVDLGMMKIKVTGTSFSVMAYRTNSNVKLKLDKGHVHVLYDKKAIAIKPGEYMVYDKKTHHLSVGKEEGDCYADWKANIYRFNEASLNDVLAVLARKYNAKFVIKDSEAATYHYSLTLSDASLQQVLSNMEISAPIRFIKKNNIYYVTMK